MQARVHALPDTKRDSRAQRLPATARQIMPDRDLTFSLPSERGVGMTR